MNNPLSARDLFQPDQVAAIQEAIMAAEMKTSGEIRVYIEGHPGEGVGVLDRAAAVFMEMDIAKTTQQNGVLFYLATEARQFAVLGDKGIDNVVPPNFWDSIKDKMQAFFRETRFTEGLIEGINMAGEALIQYFPRGENDQNELSDEVIFG